MTWNASALAHLQAREGYAPRWVFWCNARRVSDGVYEEFSIWQGEDDVNLPIDGSVSETIGAQSVLSIGPIRYKMGVVIQSQTVSLNGVSSEALALTRGYDLRGCRADLHLALLDPTSFNLIDVKRMFRGYVNRAPQTIPANRGAATLELDLVSSVRDLTKTPHLYKSNASQEALSGDTGRKYATITGAANDPWGDV